MKKKIAALLMAVMAVGCLGACGSKEVPANKVFGVDDLEGKKIGVQLGTTGDIYASDIKGAEVIQYKSGTDAVQALKQGKVDCVIIDEQPAKAYVSKNDDTKILDEEFALEEYAICVSKENTELTEKINAALAELKEEGTLEQIVNAWINPEEGAKKGEGAYTSPEGVDKSNGTLTMATNAQFEPYEYKDGGDKIIGLDVDMATAIADKLGMELKITDIDFDSIITAVQSGKADIGVAGMTVTEDRLKNIDFTDSYTTSKQVIIVRKK